MTSSGVNAVDWRKSESDVGKTSYSTVGEKETWIGTVDPIIAAENSQSAKNVAKVADTTLSEGCLLYTSDAADE